MIRKKFSHLRKKINSKILIGKEKAKAVFSRRNRTLFIKGFCIGASGPLFSALPASARDDIPLPSQPQRLINVETIRSKQSLWAAGLYFGFPIFCGLISGYFVSTYIRGFQKTKCMNLITKYESFNK